MSNLELFARKQCSIDMKQTLYGYLLLFTISFFILSPIIQVACNNPILVIQLSELNEEEQQEGAHKLIELRLFINNDSSSLFLTFHHSERYYLEQFYKAPILLKNSPPPELFC